MTAETTPEPEIARPLRAPAAYAGLRVSAAHSLSEPAAPKTYIAQTAPGHAFAPWHGTRPRWLGPGQPLDGVTRAEMPGWSHGLLDQVRIHTDSRSASSADRLGARAYAVGPDIVFGRRQFAPHMAEGRALLLHELSHVAARRATREPIIDRASLGETELRRLDRELAANAALSVASGEIGAAADGGPQLGAPAEDASLPISLHIYRRTPPAPTAPGGTSTGGGQGGAGGAAGTGDAGAEHAEGAESQTDAPGSVTPSQTGGPQASGTSGRRPGAAPRALIVGGVHGDERGPLQLVDALDRELAAGGRRDFDTLLIPRMNPWGVANGSRVNHRGVDLNRNFPGLSGFPAPSGPVPPEQPEVKAVRRVIEILRPSRILALHAITGAQKGGVFADPVEGPARELAARMAAAMDPANTRGNVSGHGAFSARYPESASVSVTTAQSSLGAWASAPTTAGGRGTPVITHEVPDKQPLAATGARSVAGIMPGLRLFLRDNGRDPSVADASLRAAVSDAFLTGEQSNPADNALLADITRIVNERFADMAAFYRTVWRPRQGTVTPPLPATIAIVGGSQGVRRFGDQARIVRGQLTALTATSTDAQIRAEIERVLTTRSMPGFSRHHWGTDIDIVSPDRARWIAGGDLVGLIPFVRDEAPHFGFFNPYASASGSPPTGGYPQPAAPHYLEEPWHLSYAPIANVIQERWAARITGAVLAALITRTATAIRGPVPQATMERVLSAMNLPSFQTNVAPPP